MSTTFYVPKNNCASTVASPYTAGGGTITLADASTFPTTFPFRLSTFTAAGIPQSILSISGRSSNVLTIAAARAIEGTTDTSLATGALAEIRVTAGALSDVHTAVNAAETAIAAGVPAAITATTPLHFDGPTQTISLPDPVVIGQLAVKGSVTVTDSIGATLTTFDTSGYGFPRVYGWGWSSSPATGVAVPTRRVALASLAKAITATASTAPGTGGLSATVEMSTNSGSTWSTLGTVTISSGATSGTLTLSSTTLAAGTLLRVNFGAVNGALGAQIELLTHQRNA